MNDNVQNIILQESNETGSDQQYLEAIKQSNETGSRPLFITDKGS